MDKLGIMEFIELFTVGTEGTMAIAFGSHVDYSMYKNNAIPIQNIVTNSDKPIYFSPSIFGVNSESNKKEEFISSNFCWVELDRADYKTILPPIPPTLVVKSGNGFHIYWQLLRKVESMLTLESLNKILMRATKGDSGYNCNRMLRIPETTNIKKGQRKEVHIVEHNPGNIYGIADIQCIPKIRPSMCATIRSGNAKKYDNDRSTRDFAIATTMLKAGASDYLVRSVFGYEVFGCSDKARTEPSHYLNQTLTKAQEVIVKNEDKGFSRIRESDSGYISVTTKEYLCTSFTLKPMGEIYSKESGEFLGYQVEVKTAYGNTYVLSITMEVFLSKQKFQAAFPFGDTTVFGSDADIPHIKEFLYREYIAGGIKKIEITEILGLHKTKGRWSYVTKQGEITEIEVLKGYDQHILYNDKFNLNINVYLDQYPKPHHKKLLQRYLLNINKPNVVLTILGWTVMALIKEFLYSEGIKLPILNITGTTGAGKTKTITTVIAGFFGRQMFSSTTADTTKFPVLAMMAGTNAQLASLTEARDDVLSGLTQTLLTAYDHSSNPRGTTAQKLNNYSFIAPVIIDGEDVPTDNALRQRIVSPYFFRTTIEEGTLAYQAMAMIEEVPIYQFFLPLVQYLLDKINNNPDEVLSKRMDILDDFLSDESYKKIPIRLLQGHALCVLGAQYLCDFLGIDAEVNYETVEEVINNVYSLKDQKVTTAVDEFIIDIILQTDFDPHHNDFSFYYNKKENWFHFNRTAYNWWVQQRRRMGKPAFSFSALQKNVQEVPYYVKGSNISGGKYITVSLEIMNALNYEVPSSLDVHDSKSSEGKDE